MVFFLQGPGDDRVFTDKRLSRPLSSPNGTDVNGDPFVCRFGDAASPNARERTSWLLRDSRSAWLAECGLTAGLDLRLCSQRCPASPSANSRFKKKKMAAIHSVPSASRAAGSLLEVMSHVSSFLARSDEGTWKREGTESVDEENDGENRGRESVYAIADSFFFSALLLADPPPPSVSFSRFAPRSSRAEKEARARSCAAVRRPSVRLSVRPSITGLCWCWPSA